MLQATLDIEFLHQTLSDYLSPKAEETLHGIYNLVENKYDKSAGADSLKRELNGVKQSLMECKQNTKGQFACFRKAKKQMQ